MTKETYLLWGPSWIGDSSPGSQIPNPLPEWKTRAKLDHGLSGTWGTLTLGEERILFLTPANEGSRSWRLIDIENASGTNPLDLTLTTSEKSGWFRGGMRQFHFQLQQALPEEPFYALWCRINSSQGLRFLDPEAAERSSR